MEKLLARQTSITGNTVVFCRFLRSKGYTITSSEETDAVQALQLIPPVSEIRYWSSLRAVLSKNKYQFENFEDLYKEYKFQISKAVDSKTKSQLNKNRKSAKPKTPSIEALKSWLYNKPMSDESELSSYSNVEVLARKDFTDMDQSEIIHILNLFQKLSQKILRKKSRTKIRSRKKGSTDLRLTMRRNLRSGTEIKELVNSKRKDKKLKLVLLCDVSRSMDLYTRFFIQMIYAFHNGYDRIETFVFSTALHRVSDLLANHDYNLAFEMISERVPEWSGGTKIGSCLKTFCNRHAHCLLDRKTVVMILSDGWDTGDPEVIKTAMKEIYKSCRKVIWLNPLAGHPSFEPEVVGIKSALPYINRMHSAHNLESLKQALQLL